LKFLHFQNKDQQKRYGNGDPYGNHEPASHLQPGIARLAFLYGSDLAKFIDALFPHRPPPKAFA